MREIEVVVLDMYGCYLAKEDVRKMFRLLDAAKKGRIPKDMILYSLSDRAFRDFLLGAESSELMKYFDEKEREIIYAYREIVRGAPEAESLREYIRSFDFETFANFILKLTKLRISSGCLRNFELGEKIFEKELSKIAEYFKRWKRGEIDYKRLRDGTARWRRRIDDKIEDLFDIIWRKDIEEEERAYRRALGLE